MHSSSYYQKSQIKFDKEIKKFENKITESLSDYQKYYSDLKFSDGLGGRARMSTKDDALSLDNHRYNPYENYAEGQNKTIEMPKTKLALAFGVPFVLSVICIGFVAKVTFDKKKKK